jgi:hypothetical protein
MAYPKVWWTDGARRLDTSWAAGAVGEALLGTVGVSALGKEVGLAVHTTNRAKGLFTSLRK